MNIEKKYDGVNVLKIISCFAIIAMHVRANTEYSISGDLYNLVIPSWTQLVFLFLMISSFGMNCGYFKKFKSGNIDIEQFYLRRYTKILPFFALLVMIESLVIFNKENLYEAFIELTLLFGLLPNNNLSVIGVSWTIGVIFVFYFLFPFFVFLLSNKYRAWAAFIISIIANYLCTIYFFSSKFVMREFPYRHSFIFCFVFFMAGGIIYLYRNTISTFINKIKWTFLFLCICITILYYFIPDSIFRIEIFTLKLLIIFMMWLCYAISIDSKLLNNKFIQFFSDMSFEMYLAQMVIFRGLEKLHLLYLWGNGWMSYITIFVFEIIGLVIFIKIYKKASSLFRKRSFLTLKVIE